MQFGLFKWSVWHQSQPFYFVTYAQHMLGKIFLCVPLVFLTWKMQAGRHNFEPWKKHSICFEMSTNLEVCKISPTNSPTLNLCRQFWRSSDEKNSFRNKPQEKTNIFFSLWTPWTAFNTRFKPLQKLATWAVQRGNGSEEKIAREVTFAQTGKADGEEDEVKDIFNII